MTINCNSWSPCATTLRAQHQCIGLHEEYRLHRNVPSPLFTRQPPPTGRKLKLPYIAIGLNRDWRKRGVGWSVWKCCFHFSFCFSDQPKCPIGPGILYFLLLWWTEHFPHYIFHWLLVVLIKLLNYVNLSYIVLLLSNNNILFLLLIFVTCLPCAMYLSALNTSFHLVFMTNQLD